MCSQAQETESLFSGRSLNPNAPQWRKRRRVGNILVSLSDDSDTPPRSNPVERLIAKERKAYP